MRIQMLRHAGFGAIIDATAMIAFRRPCCIALRPNILQSSLHLQMPAQVSSVSSAVASHVQASFYVPGSHDRRQGFSGSPRHARDTGQISLEIWLSLADGCKGVRRRLPNCLDELFTFEVRSLEGESRVVSAVATSISPGRAGPA